ncbi:MAG: hypothetical protein R2744_08860 [Bacteroidales bacterium]
MQSSVPWATIFSSTGTAPSYEIRPDRHPEQGPVWEHVFENLEHVIARFRW